MDRRRSLIAAGTIAGVALFGGTALAGAEGDTSETDPTVEEASDDTVVSFEDESTEEHEADDDTDTDDAEKVAFESDDGENDATDSDDTETRELQAADIESDGDVGALSEHDGDRPTNHGQVVSETARSTEPGPGHGEAVSEVARSDDSAGSSQAEQARDNAADKG